MGGGRGLAENDRDGSSFAPSTANALRGLLNPEPLRSSVGEISGESQDHSQLISGPCADLDLKISEKLSESSAFCVACTTM